MCIECAKRVTDTLNKMEDSGEWKGLPPTVDEKLTFAQAHELALKVLREAEGSRDVAAQRDADRALGLEGSA